MAHSRLLLGLACLGVSVCAACGSNFTGGNGSGGNAGAPSDGSGTSTAGDDSGGSSGHASAGAGDSGGATSPGGTSSGGSGTAGSGTAGSAGSSAGAGGSSGKAGAAGSAGTGGATDCMTLEAEYTPLLEKARECDKGSTDECTPSSKIAPLGGCGCPVLVNAKSAATTAAQKKYKELEDNKCLNTGIKCNIACLPTISASCQQQTMGTGTTFLCTGSSVMTAN